MNRLERLQQAHPFLSEEKARLLCVLAYQVGHHDSLIDHHGLSTDEWMEICLSQFQGMEHDDIKNLVAQAEEYTCA